MTKPSAIEASRTDVTVGPSVLVGLVGAGIQASRTPALHEREGAEHGLRYVYKLDRPGELGRRGDGSP
jgi:shikimate dehydrogenase